MIAIDKECKYCNIKFEDGMGFKKIGKHVKHTHNKTLLEMYMDVGLITEDDFPMCDGCGKKIDLRIFPRTYKVLQNPNNDWYHNNECKLASEKYKMMCSRAGTNGGKATKGRIVSEEERNNRRQSMLKILEERPEIKIKQSLAKLGKKNSPEHCANISKGRKGIIFSKEHCNNLSKAITQKMLNGWYYGNKCKYLTKDNKNIIFKSTYELLFAYFLDNYSEIESWKYEPLVLKHPTENKRYVPDFLVKYKNGETHIVECDRYIGFKEEYGYGWKIDVVKEYCEKNNYKFQVIDFPIILELYKNNNIKINISTLFELAKNKNGAFQLKKYLENLKHFSDIIINITDLNNPEYGQENDMPWQKEIHSSGKKDKSKLWIIANNPAFWNARWGVARWSLYDALKQPVAITTIVKNIPKYNRELSPFGLIKQAMRERYSVSFFPAWWMRWALTGLEKEYGFKPKTILDPSAGWGGRLVGAYQFDPNIKYIGIDPNEDTISGLKNISEKLNYETELHPIKLQDFDYNNKQFDLILTSPPYWDREIYREDMIVDINGYYETLNEIDTKYIILNFGSDDLDLYKDIINNTLNKYKLIDTWKIKLSKHPFQKTKLDKYEMFTLFKKKS